MRFTRIELENVFAYDKLVRLDIPEQEPGKNIVLVWGRNGMGKTSFLRSLRLLFLGVEPPEMRTVGFPPRVIGQRQYVVGDGGNWSGLVNRRAMRRATTDGTPVTARVSASWIRTDGSAVMAERSWTVSLGSYTEHVNVYNGVEKLSGQAATDALGDLLPPEFIPFFFFDGEDIKSLAEIDERKPIDFDRLLRITFVVELVDALGKIVTERQRRNMSEQLVARFTSVESALVKARGARDDARNTLAEIDDGLAEDAANLKRLQTRRETLASGASSAQRELLEKRRSELKGLIDEQHSTVAESVPTTAPLLANPRLLSAALRAVDQRLEAASKAERTFLDKVTPMLPAWLRDGPVEIEEEPAERIAAHLTEKLAAELPEGSAAGPFASIGLARAERLKAMLSNWTVAGPDTLSAQAAELDALRRYQREYAEISEALIQIEVGSQSNLELYRATVDEIRSIEERIADGNQRKGGQAARLAEALARIEEYETELKGLRASQEKAGREREDVRFLSRVTRSLNELREELRVRTRTKLEERINHRFRELVVEHGLIDRIVIDEQYTLSFLDAQGRHVGRSSLSAGLKQLAATALLWAMKDVSRIEMPLVIDTPLGRIDRENQDNMLINYYPEVASQVIILPTNSEIDAERFKLIENHVGPQFTIVNETGDAARVDKRSLIGA
jgi:DNA sulfur modification protein DndD